MVRKVFAGFGKSPDFLDHVHQLIGTRFVFTESEAWDVMAWD